MEWFIRNYAAPRPRPVAVLDVGSFDVSRIGTYGDLFRQANMDAMYTGLDLAAGPNVDVVVPRPYHWDMLPDELFDVVVSGQAFEHMEFFWLTMGEIARVLKRGGLACIIAPRGHALHRHPIDTYRFDADGMIALARYANLTPLHASTNLAPPGAGREWYAGNDSMLVAEKPLDWAGMVDPALYEYREADLQALATGMLAQNAQAY